MKKIIFIFIIISCLMLSSCCMIELTYPGRDKLKWKFSTNFYIYSSPAIGSDGTVYIGSEKDILYAINPDGTKKWEFLAGNVMNLSRQIRSSPVIANDGTVYVGSWDYDLYAIQTNCGGPADSPWPMFRHDAQHTGRK